jgi:hypothetical protein
MTTPDAEFDRDEVMVCMLIAFCLGNATLSVMCHAPQVRECEPVGVNPHSILSIAP